MKILIACEYSGTVRDAFIRKGFDAVSCDTIRTESNGPHYKCDVREILNEGWDLMIAHPPCTHLAVSGAAWFKDKRQLQEESLAFVRTLMNANISKIAIENPVSVISTRIKPPTQYVQPWHFGHPEIKKTGLWLKNLPKLKPTKVVFPRKGNVLHRLPPSEDRGKLRSLTYQGLADAMADQWGRYLIESK